MEYTEKQHKRSTPWLLDYQYKPGQSGNPGGKPKGTISIVSKLRKRLEDYPGEADAIVAALIKLGSKELGAIREIIDRIDGKIEDKPVNINILITPDMRALAAREMIEVTEEETQLLSEGNNAIQGQINEVPATEGEEGR